MGSRRTQELVKRIFRYSARVNGRPAGLTRLAMLAGVHRTAPALAPARVFGSGRSMLSTLARTLCRFIVLAPRGQGFASLGFRGFQVCLRCSHGFAPYIII